MFEISIAACQRNVKNQNIGSVKKWSNSVNAHTYFGANVKPNKSNDICNQCMKPVETQFLRQRTEGPAICDLCIEDLFSDDYKIISLLKLIAYLVTGRIFRAFEAS